MVDRIQTRFDGSKVSGARKLCRDACHAALCGSIAMFSVLLLTTTQSAFAQSTEDTAKFDITSVVIEGNTLLSAAQLDTATYSHLGPQRGYKDVETLRAALESAYQKLGYMTVSVVIPEQTVSSNGTLALRLQVLEQKIGDLNVVGNTRTDTESIRKLAGSMQPGSVPNFKQVEKDILVLNKMADRRVTPNLQLGKEAGTVDVELKVEETFPLHVTAELNNSGSASTTDLRASASVSYNDLWGIGDIVTVSAQTAPERTDDGKVFSASYVGGLPSAAGQWVAYAVRTDSDIAIVSENLNVVGKGSIYGLRTIFSLPAREQFFHSISLGADHKDFEEALLLGADSSSTPIKYTLGVLKYQAGWQGKKLKSELSLAGTFGLRGLSDETTVFDTKRIGARSNFFHLRADTSQTYLLGKDFQFFGQAAGQWSGRPLISNEQFGIGGADSVRGYYQSESLGDYGASLQLELRSPSFAGPGTWWESWLSELRVHAFFDAGAVTIHDPLREQDPGDTLLGTGLGLRFVLFDFLKASCDAGFALRDGPSTEAESVAVAFRVWGEW